MKKVIFIDFDSAEFECDRIYILCYITSQTIGIARKKLMILQIIEQYITIYQQYYIHLYFYISFVLKKEITCVIQEYLYF